MTHSFGSDTIIVEPPVTEFTELAILAYHKSPRFIASTFHHTYALNIDYSEIYINTYCNVKSNGQPYGLDALRTGQQEDLNEFEEKRNSVDTCPYNDGCWISRLPGGDSDTEDEIKTLTSLEAVQCTCGKCLGTSLQTVNTDVTVTVVGGGSGAGASKVCSTDTDSVHMGT